MVVPPARAVGILVGLGLSIAGGLGWAIPMAEQTTTPTPTPDVPSPSPQQGPLITVESDVQQADNVTGVVTATGNVRVLYPEKKLVATARQAQYFTKEGRIILSGDVDVVQEGGNRLKAQRVTYLVQADRLLADPSAGDQVRSWIRLQRQAPVVPLGRQGTP